MSAIKQHDYIELDYTARTKDGNFVFDTTDENVAKGHDIFEQKTEYCPSIVCVGENHVIKGLDDRLVGKEAGKEYTIEVPMEEAFGKKDAKMIQMIPTSKFLKQRINPVPGLQINIDVIFGTIKTVSSGRALVDFNHPLSGKDLVYTVKINRAITDDAEKIKALLKIYMHAKNPEIKIEGDTANIRLKPSHHGHAHPQDAFEEIAKRTIPSVKNYSITEEPEHKPEAKPANSAQKA